VTDCPVAPGLRPGHLAEVEAARRDADQRIARAAREHDETAEEAAVAARQARDEATRARAAETGIRAELDRTRAGAGQLITRGLADAARERAGLRAQSAQQAERLQAELRQVREDAACLVGQVRDSAADRIADLEEAATQLQAERDQLTADLRTAHRPPRTSIRAQREARSPGSRGGRVTKPDQMIEQAGQGRDLASVPLAEVSQLAISVAAEIGYSPGTARRELVRYVRGLQATAAENQSTPDKQEGTIDD
jgi:chromosome segregation ATPase